MNKLIRFVLSYRKIIIGICFCGITHVLGAQTAPSETLNEIKEGTLLVVQKTDFKKKQAYEKILAGKLTEKERRKYTKQHQDLVQYIDSYNKFQKENFCSKYHFSAVSFIPDSAFYRFIKKGDIQSFVSCEGSEIRHSADKKIFIFKYGSNDPNTSYTNRGWYLTDSKLNRLGRKLPYRIHSTVGAASWGAILTFFTSFKGNKLSEAETNELQTIPKKLNQKLEKTAR